MKKYVEKYKAEKRESFNIVIFSVVLSTIINIISGALCELYDVPPMIYIISGSAITIALIIGSLFYKINELNETVSYKGMFIVDRENKNSLIKIPEYPISRDMYEYLSSAFVENKAMQKVWENGKLDCSEDNQSGSINKKYNDTKELLVELIEYSVLENFSTFISDYFNMLGLRSKVEKWSKESVPEILFSNRFLKLFSEDMNNRNAFVETEVDGFCISDDSDGEIIASYKDGALYQKFDLYLPKGTKIHKNTKNSITIDTKLFVLNIEYLYEGFSTVISNEFYRFYIGQGAEPAYHGYQFYINLNVKYKWLSILKIFDWKYYNWLDEYVERLEKYCDKEAFFEIIGWRKAKAFISVLNNMRKK